MHGGRTFDMKATQIKTLPTSRAFLHFEAVLSHGENWQVDYELVVPLQETDCRGTWDRDGRKTRPKNHRIIWLDKDNNRRIPMGRTHVGCSNRDYPFFRTEDRIDLPFRDGAHCQWDNDALGGLEVFYSKGGKHWKLTKED